MTSVVFRHSLFSNSIRHFTTHALLIGGGTSGRTISRIWKQNQPEIAEYQDVYGLSNHMIRTGQVSRENMSIYFGNGNTPPKVLVYSRIGRIIQNRVFPEERVSQTEIKAEFPVFNGAASLANLETGFTSLSQKLTVNDHLIIIISGHGLLYRGTVLWNKYFCRQTLSTRTLKSYLDKLENKPLITIFISSCYSGQFLSLANERVTIVTTSSIREVSFYCRHTGCHHLHHLFGLKIEDFVHSQTSSTCNSSDRFSMEQSGIPTLQRFAREASNRNFYASDSLSYFVDDTIRSKIGNRVIARTVEKIQRLLGDQRVKCSADFGIAMLIATDPFNIIQTLYFCKVALATGKITLPFIKIALCIAMSSTYSVLKVRATNTALYRKWYTTKDRRLIAKVERYTLISPINSTAHRKEIHDLLLDLEKLKTMPLEPGKPLLHYHYLYDKAKLFLCIATPEEIELLLTYYKNIQRIKIHTPPKAVHQS